MKNVVLSLLLLTLTAGFANAAELSEQEKVSYAVGMSIGMNLAQQQMDLNVDQLSKGLADSLTGQETALDQQEMMQVLQAYQQQKQMEMMAQMAQDAEKNKVIAADYLKDNSSKEGVVTLDSGLQYKVLSSGEGAMPTAESTVDVHYRGTLIDGTEFDSSYKRGQVATFPVGQVIAGWTEALQLMHEGDKWQLTIPPDLAYGDQGRPPVIPPASALIFEVELVKVH